MREHGRCHAAQPFILLPARPWDSGCQAGPGFLPLPAKPHLLGECLIRTKPLARPNPSIHTPTPVVSLIDLRGPWNVEEATCKQEEEDAINTVDDLRSCSTDQNVPAGGKGHVLRRVTFLISTEWKKRKEIDTHCRE